MILLSRIYWTSYNNFCRIKTDTIIKSSYNITLLIMQIYLFHCGNNIIYEGSPIWRLSHLSFRSLKRRKVCWRSYESRRLFDWLSTRWWRPALSITEWHSTELRWRPRQRATMHTVLSTTDNSVGAIRLWWVSEDHRREWGSSHRHLDTMYQTHTHDCELALIVDESIALQGHSTTWM